MITLRSSPIQMLLLYNFCLCSFKVHLSSVFGRPKKRLIQYLSIIQYVPIWFQPRIVKKTHGFSLQIKEFTSKPLNSVSEPKGKWARIPVLEARRASLTMHRTSEECGAPGGFWAPTWHSRGDFFNTLTIIEWSSIFFIRILLGTKSMLSNRTSGLMWDEGE